MAGAANGIHESEQNSVGWCWWPRAAAGGGLVVLAVTELQNEGRESGRWVCLVQKYEEGRTETRSRLGDNANSTNRHSLEIVQYKGGGPPEPLLRQ